MILLAFCALLAILTLLAYFGEAHWTLELLSAFRLQYSLASLGLIAWSLPFRNWRALGGGALLALLNLGQVLPLYLPPSQPTSPKSVQRLTLFQNNVYYLNPSPARLIASIQAAQPDIVTLQEVKTPFWEALTGRPYIRRRYPYRILSHNKTLFKGTLAVMSRYPMRLSGRAHSLLKARIQFPDGRALRLFVSHFPHPTNDELADMLEKSTQSLLETTLAPDRPDILAGDFNATPWSWHFQRIQDGLGLRNAGRGFGVIPSWKAKYPWFLRVPIDHALIAPDIAVTDYRAGAPTGSDHLPIVLQLQL